MMDPRQVADALISAERERKPIRPFSDASPFLDAGRAYQAQQLFVEDHLNGVLAGGLTAPAALCRGGAVSAEFGQLGSVEVCG